MRKLPMVLVLLLIVFTLVGVAHAENRPILPTFVHAYGPLENGPIWPSHL